MCQRPKRALSISTAWWSETVFFKRGCVNALNGLFPFLPDEGEEGENNGDVCQRPKRALSISTVPSRKPHKLWLSSHVFASI